VTYDDCTGTLQIGPSNSCTGATIADSGDGTGTYTASAQGETAGGSTCTASVAIDFSSDSDVINIVGLIFVFWDFCDFPFLEVSTH